MNLTNRGSLGLALVALTIGAACERTSSQDALPPPGVIARWQAPTEPLLVVGGGEADPSDDLFRVADAALLTDGRLVVVDASNTIRYFSPEGALLASTGGRGGGPGEFRAVAWLQVLNDDSLAVYDPVLRRISVFSPAGEMERSVTVGAVPDAFGPAEGIAILEGGAVLAKSRTRADGPSPEEGVVRPDLLLSIHAPDGSFSRVIARVTGDEIGIVQGVIMRPPHLRKTHVLPAASGVWVVPTDSLDVYRYDEAGQVLSRHASPHAPRPLDAAQQADGFGHTTEPAVAAALTDSAGRLWIAETPSVGASEIRWLVYGDHGVPVSEVLVPADLSPLWIGSERIVGVWREDEGIETVRVLELGAPAGG